jgi:hypothetical protein
MQSRRLADAFFTTERVGFDLDPEQRAIVAARLLK